MTIRQIAVTRQAALLLACLLGLMLLSGCSTLQQFDARVAVRAIKPAEFLVAKRGDILTSGTLSASTLEAIKVAALDDGPCAQLARPTRACLHALSRAEGIDAERQLSALAELWAHQALLAAPGQSSADQLDAWLESARHAYAYLFFSARQPGERAFEDRQTQVRDYYNLAVQEAVTMLFRQRGGTPMAATGEPVGAWTFRADLASMRASPSLPAPTEVIAATSLAFTGLRSLYRRDGFGAELVSVNGPRPGTTPGTAHSRVLAGAAPAPAWSEMPYPIVTALLRFDGSTLAEVLATHAVSLAIYDSYDHDDISLHGMRVPLAGNFTAGYGLWLARSGFASKSIRLLLGREDSLTQPHLYLMQPYDPKRRIILMIHGLASSPEAWVNVANEIMGDATLRQHFQIWQVFYPTSVAMSLNHFEIRKAVNATIAHFDPKKRAPASRDMIVIGHSMGGVLARMLVSSTQGGMLNALTAENGLSAAQKKRLRQRLGSIVEFEPMPEVQRAIFIAAPHRGTPFAGGRIARLLANTIRMPLTVLENFADLIQDNGPAAPPLLGKAALRLPNGLDNLREDDRFVQVTSALPIARAVAYHSIIARASDEGPLALSDDGLVPYRSAHLDGAVSEKIITSGHSVQESAAAILELRRILHADLASGAKNVR